jgi:hypothetical protein
MSAKYGAADIDAFFDSFGDCTDADMARVAADLAKLCPCGHSRGGHRVLDGKCHDCECRKPAPRKKAKR